MYVLISTTRTFVLVLSVPAPSDRADDRPRHHLRRAEGRRSPRAYPTPVAAAAAHRRASRSSKPHDLALGTVAAVAQANAVQPSSMIRFANALGFDGFSQMQQVFRSHLVERSAPYRERIAQMRRGARSAGDGGVLHAVRRRGDRRAAPARGARRRRRALDRGGDAARRARRRSTCWRSGAPFRSPATSPTRSTSSSCARTCSTASAACSASSRARIGAGDALLVASFRNYTPEVVETALACRAPRRLGGRHHRQRAVAAEAAPPTSASSSATTRRGRSARWSRRSAWRRRWSSAPATSSPPAPAGRERTAGRAAQRKRGAARDERMRRRSTSSAWAAPRSTCTASRSAAGSRTCARSRATSAARRPTPPSACARLGLKPAMLTRVGDEHNGRFVRERLARRRRRRRAT